MSKKTYYVKPNVPFTGRGWFVTANTQKEAATIFANRYYMEYQDCLNSVRVYTDCISAGRVYSVKKQDNFFFARKRKGE